MLKNRISQRVPHWVEVKLFSTDHYQNWLKWHTENLEQIVYLSFLIFDLLTPVRSKGRKYVMAKNLQNFAISGLRVSSSIWKLIFNAKFSHDIFSTFWPYWGQEVKVRKTELHDLFLVLRLPFWPILVVVDWKKFHFNPMGDHWKNSILQHRPLFFDPPCNTFICRLSSAIIPRCLMVLF